MDTGSRVPRYVGKGTTPAMIPTVMQRFNDAWVNLGDRRPIWGAGLIAMEISSGPPMNRMVKYWSEEVQIH